MRRILTALLLLAALAPTARADSVVCSERVTSRVLLRQEPLAASRVLGGLRPGERAEHLGSESAWHHVRLEDGTTGFVSAAWTERVFETPDIPEDPVDVEQLASRRRSLLGGLGERLAGWFGSQPRARLEIREPEQPAPRYRHTDPRLAVSGVARAPGAGRLYDVVLALDASTSTNEYAETDVDGDERGDDRWMGSDSIFRAQVSAAANFVRALDRVPGNPDGRRIRVGVVTYAGEERFRLDPADADLPLSFEALYQLALRDTVVVHPLTADYAAVLEGLRRLWDLQPVGMTDVAAGIGRAVLELTGDASRGAVSQGREGANKIVLFLSDGKPRLPYDKLMAESMATFAGKLASRSGVRINAFALGYDDATRSRNYSLKRMARRSGGRYVALSRPGEIVTALGTTPFSSIDRVELRNSRAGDEVYRVATDIEGTFYGEVPLVEGDNEIRVTAVLDDGETVEERFRVEYVRGIPERELQEQLKRLRLENAALVERLRDDLASDLEAERNRLRQRRRLELEVREGS
jgi:hypothetical protein